MPRASEPASPRKRGREEEEDMDPGPSRRRKPNSDTSTTSASSGDDESDTAREVAVVEDVSREVARIDHLELPTPQPRKPPNPVPSKSGQRWTPEEDQMLIDMRRQNTPYIAIGLRLGKSHLASRLHMHNLLQKRKHGQIRMAQYFRDHPEAQHGGPILGNPAHYQLRFGDEQVTAPEPGTFRPMPVVPYPAPQQAPRLLHDKQVALRELLPAPTGRGRQQYEDDRAMVVMRALVNETGSYWHRVAGDFGWTATQLQEYYNSAILPRMGQSSFTALSPSQGQSYSQFPQQQQQIPAGPSLQMRQLPTPPQQIRPEATGPWQNHHNYTARIEPFAGDSRLHGLGEAAVRRSQAELDNASSRNETVLAFAHMALRGDRPRPPPSSDDASVSPRTGVPPVRTEWPISIVGPRPAQDNGNPSYLSTSIPEMAPVRQHPVAPVGPPSVNVTRVTASQPPVPSQAAEAEDEADVRHERTEAWLGQNHANSAAAGERETVKEKEDGPRQDSMVILPRMSIANITNPQ
ncbi:hypothetical protein LTR36_005684 [Oleoguttula mirabilis]|uniref:Myb-like domain-containing protein n=1 Tax=Oleoguttula mirabilis TaxID=1507867 RepID=A0AAV9JEZ3_9PEZI|nr:hypothetical protein LTR36_005684 [Oleoguttula mirabilis]